MSALRAGNWARATSWRAICARRRKVAPRRAARRRGLRRASLAENYERTFSPEAVFELQDDLVPRIVSTVADSSGVLPHSISEMLRKKSPDQLSRYEAVLRYFGYLERATPEEHAKARDA